MRDPADLQSTEEIEAPIEPAPGVAAPQIGRLKRRADFLRAAKGGRWHDPALTIQAGSNDASGIRIGYTLTRRVGSAVVRNRARRRLKEAVRLTPDLPVVRDHDYVIVGRIEAIRLPFATLQRTLVTGFRKVTARRTATRPKRTRPAS